MEHMATTTLGPGHTREDYYALPDDGVRHELLEGELTVVPAPSFDHQRMSAELHMALHAARTEGLVVLAAPFDVELEVTSVVQPDLIVVGRHVPEQRRLMGPPLLAVEILSPNGRGRDQLRKKRLYERAGVPSYWIVDPEVPSVTAWELRDGRYEVAALVSGDEEWIASVPYEVRIVPAELYD